MFQTSFFTLSKEAAHSTVPETAYADCSQAAGGNVTANRKSAEPRFYIPEYRKSHSRSVLQRGNCASHALRPCHVLPKICRFSQCAPKRRAFLPRTVVTALSAKRNPFTSDAFTTLPGNAVNVLSVISMFSKTNPSAGRLFRSADRDEIQKNSGEKLFVSRPKSKKQKKRRMKPRHRK